MLFFWLVLDFPATFCSAERRVQHAREPPRKREQAGHVPGVGGTCPRAGVALERENATNEGMDHASLDFCRLCFRGRPPSREAHGEKLARRRRGPGCMPQAAPQHFAQRLKKYTSPHSMHVQAVKSTPCAPELPSRKRHTPLPPCCPMEGVLSWQAIVAFFVVGLGYSLTSAALQVCQGCEAGWLCVCAEPISATARCSAARFLRLGTGSSRPMESSA